MLARVEVADVVGRGLRRVVAQRHAAGLFLELRDSRLVGLSGGAELPEDRSAATLALNGWRNGLIVEVLVTARETHQRHKTNWTGSLHDILAVGEGIKVQIVCIAGWLRQRELSRLRRGELPRLRGGELPRLRGGEPPASGRKTAAPTARITVVLQFSGA
jgi:hypothetical protein